MLAEDPGNDFMDDFVSPPIPQHKISKNQGIPVAETFDPDDSQFTTVAIYSSTAKYIHQDPGTTPDDDQATNQANRATENDQNLRPAPPEIAAPADTWGVDHPPSSMAQITTIHHTMNKYIILPPPTFQARPQSSIHAHFHLCQHRQKRQLQYGSRSKEEEKEDGMVDDHICIKI